jgi:hypothetical protein
MRRQAYTSTVVAPQQVALSAVAAAVVTLVMWRLGGWHWPVVIGGDTLFVATGVHLATVRLAVDGDRILLGPLLGSHRWRVIPTAQVVKSYATTLGWAEVFGIGVPFHWRTNRLTVRPGPTLCLTLDSGEYLRISTPDPEAAVRLLGPHPPSTALP